MKILDTLNPFSNYTPKLKVIEIDADTIEKAIKKAGDIPAGNIEFDWVLKNQNEARKILNQDNIGYFFPSTLSKDQISYVFWDKDKFMISAEKKDFAWSRSISRIVLID